MSSSYKYRGNLAETTLPEMLYTIDRFRVPGVVEARQGRIIKRVFVREGYIVHAASTDRDDSLGAHLRRQGSLAADVLRELAEKRQRSDKRFGVLLLERGLLSPAQVLNAIRQQIEAIIWSLFYWDDGSVTFELGELEAEDMVQIQLPIRQVIVEGIRRAPNAKALIGRLGTKETILEPCYEVEDLIETGLGESDFRVLRSVNGRRSLYQLCSLDGKPAGEIAKLLYAFQVLHLVRPKQVAESGRAGPVKIQFGIKGRVAKS